MKILKVIGISIGIILLIFSITNPSVDRFKDFSGNYTSKYNEVIYTKTHNYILFSTFNISFVEKQPSFEQYNSEEEDASNKYVSTIKGDYLGVLFNFYKK